MLVLIYIYNLNNRNYKPIYTITIEGHNSTINHNEISDLNKNNLAILHHIPIN